MYVEKSGHVDRSIRRPFHGKYNLIDLSKMMTFGRPARSKTEEVFIKKYIDIIPGMQKDTCGNRFIQIGKKPTTLFTSHTDTVHDDFITEKTGTNTRTIRSSKFEKQRYPVRVKGKWLYQKEGKDILGADDTTGVWMMLNLIDAKKPGLYIFHRDEEVGGTGSKYITKRKPELLHGIQRAISFDRKGYSDIITHQRGERTASDEFAKELSNRLGGGFQTAHGTFTDSANYSRLIPECTNLSIGYKDAHTTSERQNLRFARHLYGKVLGADLETLPSFRDPKKIEPSRQQYYGYNYWEDDDWKQFSPIYKRLEQPYQDVSVKQKKREIKDRHQYLQDIKEEKTQYLLEKKKSPYVSFAKTDSDLYDDFVYEQAKSKSEVKDWLEEENKKDYEKKKRDPLLPI
jgi:hypothetical protein